MGAIEFYSFLSRDDCSGMEWNVQWNLVYDATIPPPTVYQLCW